MIRLYRGKYIRILSFKRRYGHRFVHFLCFVAKLKHNDDNDGLSRQKVGGG